MPKLFVSYSRVDTAVTEVVVERLRRVYGLPNVWYDDELYGGARWWKTILEQIAACDVFIYLLSNESVTSPYCQAEFAEARRLGKPIVTVQIRDKTRLSDDLSEIQYVDMKRGLNDENLARLIRAVNEQAQVPKARRALWTPITPLPMLPTDEDANRTARAEVETPTLQLSRSPMAPAQGDHIVARATITAALITGVLAILAVVVGVILPPLLNPAPTPTLAAQNTTPRAVVASPTLPPEQIVGQTQTREAEHTLTSRPTETPIPPTPTEDAQATYDVIATGTRAYFQTQDAAQIQSAQTQSAQTQSAQTQVAQIQGVQTQNALATFDAAENLTAQPTSTPIPPTATLTSTPSPDPLTLASTPVTRNQDWTPVTQDFDGVTMVLVPAGSFEMGSTAAQVEDAFAACQAANNNNCLRSVFEAELITLEGNRQTLTPFWIDQTEVTQADFKRLGGVNANANGFEGDQRPVENITWFEARDFCELRGMRLPTEAEWEYAARGPDGLVYPWGNDWNPDNVVWAENSNSQTANVGSRPAGASWVGALDMSGNVWEWMSTIYGVDDGDYNFNESGERTYDYPYLSEDGREGDSDNRTYIRVLRGGSWNYTYSSLLRVAFHYWFTPDNYFNIIGLRCARS